MFVDAIDGGAKLGVERRQGVAPAHRAQVQERIRGEVHVEHAARRAEHQHRVGQAVDGGLRGLLRLEQLAQGGRAVLAQLVGHGVELVADLGDLVLSREPHPRVEIAFADAPHRAAQAAQRPQRAAGEQHRSDEPEEQRPHRGSH